MGDDSRPDGTPGVFETGNAPATRVSAVEPSGEQEKVTVLQPVVRSLPLDLDQSPLTLSWLCAVSKGSFFSFLLLLLVHLLRRYFLVLRGAAAHPALLRFFCSTFH